MFRLARITTALSSVIVIAHASNSALSDAQEKEIKQEIKHLEKIIAMKQTQQTVDVIQQLKENKIKDYRADGQEIFELTSRTTGRLMTVAELRKIVAKELLSLCKDKYSEHLICEVPHLRQIYQKICVVDDVLANNIMKIKCKVSDEDVNKDLMDLLSRLEGQVECSDITRSVFLELQIVMHELFDYDIQGKIDRHIKRMAQKQKGAKKRRKKGGMNALFEQLKGKHTLNKAGSIKSESTDTDATKPKRRKPMMGGMAAMFAQIKEGKTLKKVEHTKGEEKLSGMAAVFAQMKKRGNALKPFRERVLKEKAPESNLLDQFNKKAAKRSEKRENKEKCETTATIEPESTDEPKPRKSVNEQINEHRERREQEEKSKQVNYRDLWAAMRTTRRGYMGPASPNDSQSDSQSGSTFQSDSEDQGSKNTNK